MKKEKNEMLGVMLSQSDKDAIKRIAINNNVTMSFVARVLISDSLKHISERNIFKMVVWTTLSNKIIDENKIKIAWTVPLHSHAKRKHNLW